jgi:uncharacterized LabA/DUF88 family protein
MESNNMTNRTAVFIDGGYLNQVMKLYPNSQLNFEKFSNMICGKELFRTYYYNSMPFVPNHPTIEDNDRIKKANNFYSVLRHLPKYEVRLGKLICISENGKEVFLQKQVDMLLTIDLLTLSLKNKITKAIIISGDSDFVPIIKIAKDEGIQVCLFHGNNYSQELWEVCDVRRKIDQAFITACERKR